MATVRSADHNAPMAAWTETQYARGEGPAIAYQVVGAGERDFVYVAQAHTPIDLIWDDPLHARGLRRLAAAGRLITCDLRGWGSSDAVDVDDMPALQAWMDDITRVMLEVGSERAVIVGMAEQALPCILFAATYPARVEALVLWSPFARYLRASDHPCGMPPAAAAALVDLFDRANGTGEAVALYAPSRSKEPGFQDYFARCERLGVRPANAAPIYGRVFQPTDLRQVATTITSPTLLLRRRGDRHVRDGHAQRLAATMPAAKLVEFDGDDHFWWAGDSDAPIDEILTFVTGLPGRAHATGNVRQLATVLFTDIVDSTGRASSLGDDRWSDLLARHDQVVARYVAAFRGRLIKSTGDGSLATFDGPARAIRCAWDLRAALASEGLPIRAGLHTGEVEVTDSDVHGVAVHVAARVMASADEGDILVSGAVPPLVLGARITFADRGTQELRGVPGTWQLLEVTSAE